MRKTSNEAKRELLGVSFGQAMNKLRKSIMFDLVCRLSLNTCHRCQQSIEDVDTFSIEHKDSWQLADDPVQAFYDLDNISFSHLRCNIKAATKPHKRFSTAEASREYHNSKRTPESRRHEYDKRNQRRRLEKSQGRNQSI